VLDRTTDDLFHDETQIGSAESVETYQGIAERATCEAAHRRKAHHVEAIQGAPVTEIDDALRDKHIRRGGDRNVAHHVPREQVPAIDGNVVGVNERTRDERPIEGEFAVAATDRP
jgi:hypothetical protein